MVVGYGNGDSDGVVVTVVMMVMVIVVTLVMMVTVVMVEMVTLTAHLAAGAFSPVKRPEKRPGDCSGSRSGWVPATKSSPLSARLGQRDFSLVEGGGSGRMGEWEVGEWGGVEEWGSGEVEK